MADIIMRAIKFKVQTDHGEYNDCLWYTESEYLALKQGDIETEKQKRVDNWIQIVTNPLAYVEPTKEEPEEQKADLLEDLSAIQTQIDTKG